MFTVLTACSFVRYSTAGVRIVTICVQFLLPVVLNVTVRSSKNCYNMCTDLTACSIVPYSTAGVRIVKICVQFLLPVVLYGTVLQQ